MTANYSDIAQYIAEGKTPLQIVDLLRAESVRQNNLTQWSFGLIETQIDAETARTLAGVIQAAAATDPLMASAFTAMSTAGIELWSDARQVMIDTIGTAAGMTVEQIAQVKALGVTYTAVDADATVESVQALIDAEADSQAVAKKRGYVQDAQIAVNETLLPSATRADVVAAFDAALVAEGWD